MELLAQRTTATDAMMQRERIAALPSQKRTVAERTWSAIPCHQERTPRARLRAIPVAQNARYSLATQARSRTQNDKRGSVVRGGAQAALLSGVADPPSSAYPPRPLRWAATGAKTAGLVGSILGLVLGLAAHWQTAWFAIFELAIPMSILGGLVGLVTGAIAHVVHPSSTM